MHLLKKGQKIRAWIDPPLISAMPERKRFFLLMSSLIEATTTRSRGCWCLLAQKDGQARPGLGEQGMIAVWEGEGGGGGGGEDCKEEEKEEEWRKRRRGGCWWQRVTD